MAVTLLLTLFLIQLPPSEPLPRTNEKRLYVDEDLVQYYWYVTRGLDVELIDDSSLRYSHLGPSEHFTYIKVNQGLVHTSRLIFKDDKILRVQEPGQQNDIPAFTRERKQFLLTKATKKGMV